VLIGYFFVMRLLIKWGISHPKKPPKIDPTVGPKITPYKNCVGIGGGLYSKFAVHEPPKSDPLKFKGPVKLELDFDLPLDHDVNTKSFSGTALHL
jgi:hypothetical protein